MTTIYIPFYNADMTEGRGPMIPEKFGFTTQEEAENYINKQSGCMGRKAPSGGWKKNGDWAVEEFFIIHGLGEIEKVKYEIEKAKILAKLTLREREILGI